MPEHIRTTIRKAIADLLENDPALAGVGIYRARARPIGLQGTNGSAVEILVPREVTSAQGAHGESGEYERRIEVQLIGYVGAVEGETAVDGADDLSLKLETALHSDLTLGGKVIDLWLEGTDLALDAKAQYPKAKGYKTAAGAAKKLRAHGFKNVEDAWRGKFKEIHPSQIMRGDIAIVENKSEIAGGIWDGQRIWTKTEAEGNYILPLSAAKTVFRVE